MVELLKLLQVIYNFDFGFFTFESYKLKCLQKLYHVFMYFIMFCTAMPFLLEEEFDVRAHPWVTMYLLQHIIYVLIFVFFRSDSTLYKFECEIKDIDLMLKCESAARSVEKRKALWFLICSGIPGLLLFRSCAILTQCAGYITSTIMYLYLFIGLEVIMLANAFLFYSLCYRFEIIESSLRASSHDELNYLFHVYQLLTNLTTKYKSAYDNLYMLSLLFRVPDVMLSIYFIIWAVKNRLYASWVDFLINNALVFTFLVSTVTPALCAGNVTTHTQNIRNVLYDKRLHEKDELKCYELERFIRYVEARPLKFSVYKVIPLDASLLVMVIKFCVTYLIVLIQFTHLF